MAVVGNVLIVGAGMAGMTLGVALKRAGIACEIAEIRPNLTEPGTGISLQGPDVIPIPGTKQNKRLLENIGALEVKLSEAELAEISSAVPAGSAKGTRYPEAQMASLYI